MAASCSRYKVHSGLPGSAGYVVVRGKRRELPVTAGRSVEICRSRGKLVMIDGHGGRHKLKRRR